MQVQLYGLALFSVALLSLYAHDVKEKPSPCASLVARSGCAPLALPRTQPHSPPRSLQAKKTNELCSDSSMGFAERRYEMVRTVVLLELVGLEHSRSM